MIEHRRVLARLAAYLHCFDYSGAKDGLIEQRPDLDGNVTWFLTCDGLAVVDDLTEQIVRARAELGREDLDTWNMLTLAAAALAGLSDATPVADGEVAGAAAWLVEQRYLALVGLQGQAAA